MSPLRSLPPAGLEAAVRALRRELVPAGQRVIEQGALADRFYLIDSGDFRAEQMASTSGASTPLRHIARGEVFGQIGLLDGG